MKKQVISAALGAAMLLAGTALAQTPTQGVGATAPAAPALPAPLACMQTAVATRDASVLAGVGASADAVKAALSARSTALQAGWGLTDKTARRSALKVAWSDYTKAAQAARKLLRDGKHAAWTQFTKDRKACKAGNEDPGMEAHDGQL